MLANTQLLTLLTTPTIVSFMVVHTYTEESFSSRSLAANRWRSVAAGLLPQPASTYCGSGTMSSIDYCDARPLQHAPTVVFTTPVNHGQAKFVVDVSNWLLTWELPR